MSRTFLFLSFLVMAVVSPAQGKLDSLLHVLAGAKDDSNKVNTLNLVSKEFLKAGSPDTALLYANDAFALAQKLDFLAGTGQACNSLANVYRDQQNFSLSLKNFSNAMEIFKKLGRKRACADAYNNMGTMHKALGNFAEAIRVYLLSLQLFEEVGDKQGIAGCYTNIGGVFSMRGSYDEALQNYQHALELFTELKSKRGLANCYNNLGVAYDGKGDEVKALENYYAALRINKERGDKQWMANNYMNIGLIYDGMKNDQDALKNYYAAFQLDEEIGDMEGVATYYINAGSLFAREQELAKAREYTEKALALGKEMHSKDILMETYGNLSEVEQKAGNFKEALQDYKLSVLYRDSLSNEENTKKIVQSQMQYDFDKKEAAAKAGQDKKDALAIEDRQRQQVVIWSAAAGLLLVAVFAAFIFRSFLQKKRANAEILLQKQVIEDKQRQVLDSIHYAKRIQQSLLPKERYIQRSISKK